MKGPWKFGSEDLPLRLGEWGVGGKPLGSSATGKEGLILQTGLSPIPLRPSHVDWLPWVLLECTVSPFPR